MNYFLNYLSTFISIVKIYFKTKNKKNNLFFYFPIKIYQENIIDITQALSKKNNIFLIYNSYSKNQIINYHNSFLIDFNLVSFIPFKNFFMKNINFFFSSYLSYVYPPNSKNIYISHDIYDAPMIEPKLEKKLFVRINKLDFIFASSNFSKKYFENKFEKYNLKKNPKVFNTGYLKLDHLIKIFKKKKKINNKKIKVVLAPGFSSHLKKYSMTKKLCKITNTIIKNKKFSLIFRPHPLDLTKKGDFKMIKNIFDKYKKNLNFNVDDKSSYINSYHSSDILITDTSGTAYTFAFSTNKPVIFFSFKEKELLKEDFAKTYFFMDRKKVGSICNDTNSLNKQINIIYKKKNFLGKKILRLKKLRIEHLNKSRDKTVKIIKNIIDTN